MRPALALALLLAAGACPARDVAPSGDAWRTELDAWRWPAPDDVVTVIRAHAAGAKAAP